MRAVKSLLFLFLVILAGCGGAPGRPDEVEERYERIISLGPSITQNIYLLEKQDLLVGVSRYCELLPEVAEREIAGSLIDINIEQVLKLSPDVVFATTMARDEDIRKLRSLGVEVVVFREPESFEEISSHFMKVGRMLGEEKRAEEILAEIREKLDAVKHGAVERRPIKVLAQIGANPLWVSPRASFINDVIEFAGGENAGPERGGRVSMEEVLRRDPDVILVMEMGIGEEQKKMWMNYPAISAVKNGRIHIVDSNTFCSPTPEAFLEAVMTTSRILHE